MSLRSVLLFVVMACTSAARPCPAQEFQKDAAAQPPAIPLDGRGGGIIVYNSSAPGNGELFAMNADGSGQRNVTNHPANDGFGVWSPDGSKVAFVSDRDGDFGVYVMSVSDLRSGRFDEPVRIAGKRPSSRVSWHPDGSKIIFDAWPECDLYVVQADGSGLACLAATPGQEFQPQFSPDGKRIAYCLTQNDRQDIHIMALDGSDDHAITRDGLSYFPTWSPDGKAIAFNSSRPGHQDADICVTDPDGGNRLWLTDYPGLDEFPTWSPDGKRIAYQSDRGVHRIFVVNADGSDNHPITNNTSFENGEPIWRPVVPGGR